MAEWMITEGLVHIVATDAHSPRTRRPLMGRATNASANWPTWKPPTICAAAIRHSIAAGRIGTGGPTRGASVAAHELVEREEVGVSDRKTRQGDKEMGRQGEYAAPAPTPCLPLSLSPCLAYSVHVSTTHSRRRTLGRHAAKRAVHLPGSVSAQRIRAAVGRVAGAAAGAGADSGSHARRRSRFTSTCFPMPRVASAVPGRALSGRALPAGRCS